MSEIECIKYEEENEGLIILQKIEDKKIIGYCAYQLFDGNKASDSLPNNAALLKYLNFKYLDYPVRGMNWSLYVDEEYRGKNFGKVLINERLKVLKKKKIETLYVDITGNSSFHKEIYEQLSENGIVKIKDLKLNSYIVLSLN